MAGMGLLPCTTVFEREKVRTRVGASILAQPFAGAQLDAYEIHMGRTQRCGAAPFCRLQDGREEGAVQGNVFGTYLHGLFDTGELTQRLADWLLERKGLKKRTCISFRTRSTRRSNTIFSPIPCAGRWIFPRSIARWMPLHPERSQNRDTAHAARGH